jgi:Protein of unknown function (DUF3040)
MSLPARQQRMLDGIEAALQASEPHLASAFAMFGQLTQDEGPAVTEQLAHSRLRFTASIRSFTLLPMVLAALMIGALLGGTARGATPCSPSAGRITGLMVIDARQSLACTPAKQGSHAKHASQAKAASEAKAAGGGQAGAAPRGAGRFLDVLQMR